MTPAAADRYSVRSEPIIVVAMTLLDERPIGTATPATTRPPHRLARLGLLRDLDRPRRVFENIGPNWYSSIMGTGIVGGAAGELIGDLDAGGAKAIAGGIGPDDDQEALDRAAMESGTD